MSKQQTIWGIDDELLCDYWRGLRDPYLSDQRYWFFHGLFMGWPNDADLEQFQLREMLAGVAFEICSEVQDQRWARLNGQNLRSAG